MCVTCGCADTDTVAYTDPETGLQVTRPRALTQTGIEVANGLHEHGDGHWHWHDDPPAHHGHGHGHGHDHSDPHAHHDHDHGHEHTHTPRPASHTVHLETAILAKNQLLAERNRGWLAGREILALNLVSSPGSGKTSLLERTLLDLKDQIDISVIEGDQATANDAQRIRAAGARAVQVNTGTGCHLEADMLAHGLHDLSPARGSVVMIENVGNLVCPALFDLGEHAKVVILSITEGEDKPIKYPHMFKASSLMLLNKIDLLPHLRFDVARCLAYAREVNPDIEILQVSAQSGEGMAAWYAWLRHELAHAVGYRAPSGVHHA